MWTRLRFALAVILPVLLAIPAGASQPPTTHFTTPDRSVFLHTVATPVTVSGYSIAADADVEQVVVDFYYSLSTPVAGYSAHCAVFVFPFPSDQRVDWEAPSCTPPGPAQPPPLGEVRVTAHAVDTDGDVESPGTTITILVV